MKRILFLATLLVALCCRAGRVTDIVELRVAPAGGEWTVAVGDKVAFTIMLTESNVGVNGIEVEYEIGPDLMEPAIKGKATVKDGIATVKGGTMKVPGFLRCKANCTVGGKKYSAMGTIGFSPEKIEPTVSYPADFMDYWAGVLSKCRATELHPEMTLLPEKCTETVDVYQVNYTAGGRNTRFYGMLAMPKGDGPFPAVVQYPGAGVYAIDAPVSFAEKGVIAMAIGIHSIPNNLDATMYRDLEGGPLASYPRINVERRDDYYYNRVIRGAVRAIDFIETLPQFNGCVATYGGSQGGFLAIAVAALHPSVKYVAANFPAMSDLTGYAHNRAGGWPHLFKDEKARTPLLLSNLSYYDTVNFARNISVPGYYAFGFNDLTCAPTTTYSVYNSVKAPKTLYTAPLAGHFLLTEQADAERAELINFLKECK
ncbi:MAG: acetylxylan esterase [Muribaculaceae bacterium]|nr:acetylxylan esterase [Muribaculaceae bacterium]